MKFFPLRPVAQRAWFAICAATLLATGLSAQETTGSIAGLVTDPSGAGVPKAKVELAGANLVRAQETVTDDKGAYLFLFVPPGEYTVVISANGFSKVKLNAVQVALSKQTNASTKLEVGQVSTEVQVSAEASTIDTASSTAVQTITAKMFDTLPVGRSFDSLITMAPGTRSEPKAGSGTVSVDGASGLENTWIIDGLQRESIMNGALGSNQKMPYEFFEAVSLKSSGMEARFPASTGGAIEAVTRSGSNDFHGQVSFYAASDRFNAGAYGKSLAADPFDPDKFKYYGGKDAYRFINPLVQFGGSIVKNRLWYFAGFAPSFYKSDRTVTFLSNNETRTLTREDRQEATVGKIDYAPVDKLRISAAYNYLPYRQRGTLPSYLGSDSAAADWNNLSHRYPTSTYSWNATYTLNPTTVLNYRGGYNYDNVVDAGIPSGPYINYRSASSLVSGVPAQWQGPAGAFTPNNYKTAFDKTTRFQNAFEVSKIFNAMGQHTLRGGWQMNRLANNTQQGWVDGYFRIGWGRTYTCATSQCASIRGTYGYWVNRVYGTFGDVASNNQGLYLQDEWRVTRNLTLNLGVRFDREYVPAFNAGNGVPSSAIEWNFPQKFAPRVGFAYNLGGKNKFILRGSYGKLFDQFKYTLPRGSFGGDRWVDYVFPLETTNIGSLDKGMTSGAREVVDWRITSNDPNNNMIDPDLKPFQKHFSNLGVDWQISDQYTLTTRWTRNRLDRAIEDVGVLSADGEQYFIANHGYGVVGKSLGPGFPVGPKAVSHYDALEFALNRRLTKGFFFQTSYVWSRLWGNYSGLANSDEATSGTGRTDPNVSRNFDLPWEKFNAAGQPVLGRLATDRPHTFKLFATYTKNWGRFGATNFAPRYVLYSGTPVSTQVSVSNLPILAFGRGDQGRTPLFTNTDLRVYHDFKPSKNRENVTIRFEAQADNLFNNNSVLNKYPNFINANSPGGNNIAFDDYADIFRGFNVQQKMREQNLTVDPLYLLANQYQAPRSMRFCRALYLLGIKR